MPNPKLVAGFEKMELPAATWTEIDRIAREAGVLRGAVLEAFVAFVAQGIKAGSPVAEMPLPVFIERQFQGSSNLVSRLHDASKKAEGVTLQAVAVIEMIGRAATIRKRTGYPADE
jgi:hypothetical protein